MNYLRLITATALCLVSLISYAQSTDEKAIKAVIEGESAAFYQGKANKVLAYWLNAPYVSHGYTEKGYGYLRGFDVVSEAMRKYIADHPQMATDKTVYTNHDYRIHVNGTSAWATYITDAVNGAKKSQSYNGRYLEKANGTWKMVANTGKPAP